MADLTGFASEHMGMVVRWVDGDTVVVDAWQETVTATYVSFGTKIQHIIRTSQDQKHLRLIIVDTPERGQPGYKEARQHCEAILPPGSPVRFIAHGEDDAGWGRTLADVFPLNSDVGMSEHLLLADMAEVWAPR